MDSETEKLFRVIFQEAHVLDCDFSKWDQRIRFVVVGGLVGNNFAGQGPIHQVDFVDADEFNWKSRHLSIRPETVDEHCQWVIMDFDLNRAGDVYVVELKSVAPSCPQLCVTCREIEINELAVAAISRVNPDWNRASAPLARPSIEDWAHRIRGPKGNRASPRG